ncbi:sel1 repeat family protein [Komagataeibacter rhaeticus]|uniref:tetratricopeptide repeat protein n=1 Tax=Komagataeibacter rhaeticus TaxID=215221 RepID=UPI000691B310|nr:tetratricopeptide repeat protein [Komagataeibacter rhaeticus]MBL7238990.1 sel1 repeat family protein [Komagataeibacter rhaeticus]MDT8871716.1 tetratricopeptide repeat protein [Komagataeibacter rhaeticus]PYD54428.1 sel1 repeat family protein [Komagataeibacter rhaeticus]
MSRSDPALNARNHVPGATAAQVVETQLMLGQIHLDRGMMEEAFLMFEAAARSHDPRALNMLGRAYERGWGTARNAARAALYFAEAARQDYGWAAFNLADLYLAGRGVAADPDRAGRLYVRAARGGVAKALTMLGLLVEDGVIHTSHASPAASLFHAAAMGGDCWGALNLGRLHLSRHDAPAARPWLERALAHGFDDVFRALAQLVAGQADPALRRIGHIAASRLQATTEYETKP